MAANMWCGKVKRPCRKVGIASPVRQSDGDGVGCKVSAFRSHCSTEILIALSELPGRKPNPVRRLVRTNYLQRLIRAQPLGFQTNTALKSQCKG